MSKGRAGTLTVSRTILRRRDAVDVLERGEDLEVREFVTETAKVTYEAGGTFNLGNYESVRVSVRVELPCYAEEVTEVYEEIKEYVGERLKENIKEVKGFMTKTGRT